jgi:hypothetical protein
MGEIKDVLHMDHRDLNFRNEDDINDQVRDGNIKWSSGSKCKRSLES